MHPKHLSNQLSRLLSLALCGFIIVGCSDDDSIVITPCTENTGAPIVAIAARAADYSAGQIQVRSRIEDTHLCNYPATNSDIDVATDGTSIFQLGKYEQDSLSKYSLANDSTPVYQFSLLGEESTANPYQVIFASETKAYVIRYGSDKIWIIDPSASTEANFKTGELDISAYDSDAPNANGAVLLNGKLFVLMERLDGFNVTKQGYIAVFDTTTDTEIDTGQGTADGLMGIALGVSNPTGLQYSESNDLLYVIGRGNYFGTYNTTDNNDENDVDRFSGGLVTIDPESYAASLLLDDGTETENQGFFIKLVTVSADKSYLVTNTGTYSGTSTLRSLHSTTGILDAGSIAGLASKDIAAIALSPENQLWVGVNDTAPRIDKIDIVTNQVSGSFESTLVPINFVFIK